MTAAAWFGNFDLAALMPDESLWISGAQPPFQLAEEKRQKDTFAPNALLAAVDWRGTMAAEVMSSP